MTRDDLVSDLLAERFGPLPSVLPERRPDVGRRRRVLLQGDAADDFRPPAMRIEIDGDVAVMAQRGWSVEQIASLLGVGVVRVRRTLRALRGAS